MENYDSTYSIHLGILNALGGDTTIHYDSTYSVDLAILELVSGGSIGGKSIEIVDELPEASEETLQQIYRVEGDKSLYFTLDNDGGYSWEKIGTDENDELVVSTAFDLLNEKVDTNEENTISRLAGKEIKGAATNVKVSITRDIEKDEMVVVDTFNHTIFSGDDLIRMIVKLTEDEYELLETKAEDTLYIITPTE